MAVSNLSVEEISCIYRCISMAMDWRDAVDEEIVREEYSREWLTYNIQIALDAANKLSQRNRNYDN